MNKMRLLSFICLSLITSSLLAQEQRWFEIELVIFTQSPDAPLQERFSDQVTPIKAGRAYDLLTPLFKPEISQLLNALPLCETTSSFTIEQGLHMHVPTELCLHEPQTEIWQQANLFEGKTFNSTLPYPEAIPSLITGIGEHREVPYLAERSTLQFNDLVSKLKRQRNKQVLLHTSWRQAPVTERLAIASHWFAGKNYTEQFDYWGLPVPAEEKSTVALQNDALPPQLVPDAGKNNDNQLLSNIDSLLKQLAVNSQLAINDTAPLIESENGDVLAQRNLPTEVWQLDGLFKLHLDHYLFVNTEFNLRLPGDGKLQTIYIRQSRRVISGEMHYLDHPYLGMIVQIRRFEPPIEDADDQDNARLLLND